MKIAIVGTSRLDSDDTSNALSAIEKILDENKSNINGIITGDASGIDELVRVFLGDDYDVTVCKAKDKKWEGNNGFKQRNISIAELADKVYSIATKKIKDKRCYHCNEQNHDRTGGCWTKKYAMDKLHKDGETIII